MPEPELEEDVDDDVKKQRISGVRETAEENEEHTRPTARPPANVTEELVEYSRGKEREGTLPGQPSRALLAAEDEAAIEAARKAFVEEENLQGGLPRDDFEDLIELLQEDLEPSSDDPFGGLIPVEDEIDGDYGGFDPRSVPVLGTWSDLGRLCLGGRAVMLLGLIDGKSTIAEIVEASNMPVSEAVDILGVLVDHGAVDIEKR